MKAQPLSANWFSSRASLLVAVLLLAAGEASGDTVITTTGRRLEGRATVSAAGVVVSAPGTAPQVVPLGELFSLKTTVAPKPPTPRLYLTSGAVLPVREIQGIHGDVARATSIDGAALTVPLVSLSAWGFKPGAELPAEAGALLTNGDFFPAAFLNMANMAVDLESPLFGRRLFPMSQLAALRLRPVSGSSAPFTVRLRDGTVARSETLTLSEGAVAFELLPKSPPKTIAMGEIVSIEHSVGPVATLLDQVVTPEREASLVIPPNTAAVVVQVRIDPALLPVARTRVVCLLDGVEVFRTGGLTSLDDPQVITLATVGKSRLTFKLESSLTMAARAEVRQIQMIPGR